MSKRVKPTLTAGEYQTTVFENEGSQAVRIPKAFRFEGSEVYIRRDVETGNVVLSARKPSADTTTPQK